MGQHKKIRHILLAIALQLHKAQAQCDCTWTQNYACPTADTPGTDGYAKDDGSPCYYECCPPTPSAPPAPPAPPTQPTTPPTPPPPTPPPYECDCDWTADYACPTATAPGAQGYADDDGSQCYHHCCPSPPSPPFACDCSWTFNYACPGSVSPGLAGFADDDGTQCFEFCCYRSPPPPPPSPGPPPTYPAVPPVATFDDADVKGQNQDQQADECPYCAVGKIGWPLFIVLIVLGTTVPALVVVMCLWLRRKPDTSGKKPSKHPAGSVASMSSTMKLGSTLEMDMENGAAFTVAL